MLTGDQHTSEFVQQSKKMGTPHVLIVHDLLQMVFTVEVGMQPGKQFEVVGAVGGRHLHDEVALLLGEVGQQVVSQPPLLPYLRRHRNPVTLYLN